MVDHVIEQKTLVRKAIRSDSYIYGWLDLKQAVNYRNSNSIEFELNNGGIASAHSGSIYVMGAVFISSSEIMVITLGMERKKHRFEFSEGPDKATTDRLMIQVQTAIRFVSTPRSSSDFIRDMKDSYVWSEFLTESFDILKTDELVEV